MSDQVVKEHLCGDGTVRRFTESDWSALPMRGRTHVGIRRDGRWTVLEQRVCPECQSAVGRRIYP
jgi:hypothetical protein